MSDPPTVPSPAPRLSTPRRVAPQLGPMAWMGEALRVSEIMIPLGAEHAAETQASSDAPAPRLEALAADLAGRLDHGHGLALLRGLPQGMEPALLLRRLGARLGTPVAEEEAARGFGDALLLHVPEPAEALLLSAACLHNALMRADRAALAGLYEPQPETGFPVFSAAGGVFSARRDANGPPGRMPTALAALPAEPGQALRLPLQRGDVLAVNTFLVWPAPEGPLLPGAARLLLRLPQTRMDAPDWAPLRAGAPRPGG